MHHLHRFALEPRQSHSHKIGEKKALSDHRIYWCHATIENGHKTKQFIGMHSPKTERKKKQPHEQIITGLQMFGMSLFWKFHKTCTISLSFYGFSYAFRFAYRHTEAIEQIDNVKPNSQYNSKCCRRKHTQKMHTKKRNIFYHLKN